MGQSVVTERVIVNHDCLAEGAGWLAQADPRFGPVLRDCGPLPLRLKPQGFGELLSAIVSQQVSVASANAIWARMVAAGLDQANAVRAATEDALREVGLSRQKILYAHALAHADIDYDALQDVTSPDVIRTLTAVSGIGTWTAEIYAMFSLGRADVFAHGDLALQEAAKVAFDLPERPREKDMRVMAADWSPWRSVAARALWAYYKHIKQRDGIT